ncbi:MAG: alpha-D-glucose phosphate-specific phosphoglucomutase [Alphaproteobacteria bacterium]|nr:alpha-D-glucose phosphate-specific phosphoglucomutase [Alphaproteobacteria bacterium]
MIEIIKTTPYTDQKMGTAGLRKKSKVVMQEHYFENFLQSIFNVIAPEGKTFVIGGDGRFYNSIAIQKLIKMSAANGVKKLIVGKNGYLSTPASSNMILKNHTDGGFVLTASHNPGGENGDFGIKYATETGGQCSSQVSDKIFEQTKNITEFKILQCEDIKLDTLGSQKVGEMEVEIVDPITDYVKLMESIFDFDAIKKMFANGFTMRFDAMNAVTGPYAIEIFENVLGAAKGSVLNATPKQDFGGLHPDPNLVYAKELVDIMYGENAPDFGAANDGDGDRNMILGKKFFVTPSDSLAILTDNYALIPAYKGGIFGVAKSMATSTAVARVADAHKIGYYEVPTGWKYFVNLMDSKRITFCGEESFGTGSSHIREKDGIWAVLFWLNIIAATGKSVEEITTEHWQKYGRSYYLRFDFDGIPTDIANDLMKNLEEKLPSLNGQEMNGFKIKLAEVFTYNDPVDHSSTSNGMRILMEDGSRIVFRLSGTSSSGATLRVYLEKLERNKFDANPRDMVDELLKMAMNIAEIEKRTGKKQADVTT